MCLTPVGLEPSGPSYVERKVQSDERSGQSAKSAMPADADEGEGMEVGDEHEEAWSRECTERDKSAKSAGGYTYK